MASTTTRKIGKVKFFNSQKGFGFIIPSESTADAPLGDGKSFIFVHHTAIHNDGGFKSLAEGEEVEYDLVQGTKGLQASNVTGPMGAPVIGEQKGYNNQSIFNNVGNSHAPFNNAYTQTRFSSRSHDSGLGFLPLKLAYGGGYINIDSMPFGQGAGNQHGYNHGYTQSLHYNYGPTLAHSTQSAVQFRFGSGYKQNQQRVYNGYNGSSSSDGTQSQQELITHATSPSQLSSPGQRRDNTRNWSGVSH
ncbi:Y box binding protein 1 [Linnemannia zychae]|nr:Y box binding protein 1 [Linnemannia zychae]